MRSKVSISLIIASSLSLSASIGTASELSDAEKRYSEVKLQYERDLESANVLLPSSIAESQRCVDSYAGSSNPEDLAARDKCQIALTRFQVERQNLMAQLPNSKNELATLETLIQSLKTSVNNGISSNSNSSASATDNAATANAASPSLSSSQISSSSSKSEEENSTTVQSAPSASSSAIPESPQSSAVTQSVKPLSTQSSTVSSPKSPSSAAVATAKKRTITCVKGKTIRKVTALKPVCPKGYKLKK